MLSTLVVIKTVGWCVSEVNENNVEGNVLKAWLWCAGRKGVRGVKKHLTKKKIELDYKYLSNIKGLAQNGAGVVQISGRMDLFSPFFFFEYQMSNILFTSIGHFSDFFPL